ncbi:Xaa-Pro peptidase family protein [Arthrobacter sp. I2-34]|uniref:Xaa-Pro peptidase family protein n=1 Tax=Arthrobacter hankyongi TaxID=2904801 RepID=A0ABS9L8N2_9MICC|nr:Xaa-Pro peptidase family protein [Arthrobacter hankyongi]MCG2623022.1 Xaa-Pro peptidase family protein [Arthrobacter hankyongi]
MYEAITAVSELAGRRDRFRERMLRAGFDAAIISSPLSIHYLTGVDLGGFLSPQALIFCAEKEPVLVVREIEMTWQEHWAQRSWCKAWSSYRDDQDAHLIIGETAKRLIGTGVRRLGLELNRPTMSYDTVQKLLSAIRPEAFDSITETIEGMRRIKSATEIGFMKEAGKIAASGVYAQADAVRNGATDTQAVSAAFAAMLEAGASLLADPPSLPVGPGSARAHSHWDGKQPADGDVVTFFMAGSYGRYQCPVERTFVYGQDRGRSQGVIDAVVEVQSEILGFLKPGVVSSEADHFAKKLYEARGLEQYRVCRLGYSIGIAYPPGWWENEIAQIRPGSDLVLEPGMTFHIVPCLCVPDVGFVNRSMAVAITGDGCEPLIDLPIDKQVL